MSVYAIDFEYDGQRLSDYRYLICDFDYSSGAVSASSGSVISFNVVSRNGGKDNSLTSTSYDERIEVTFDICKDPDETDDRIITSEEYRQFMRWLNRREFLKLRFLGINEDGVNEDCYFNASFNIEKIKIHETLYGLRLNMTTDCAYGHGNEISKTLTFSSANSSQQIDDMSDESGYTLPKVVISCTNAGDLTITNTTFGLTTEIKNCVAGEVITIDSNLQTISTSQVSHKIQNDFNYEFPVIGNTYSDRSNTIKASIPCQITLTYSPAIKVSP